MEPLEFVTFDVAGTLIDVRWTPARMANAAIRKVGLPLPADAGDDFARLFAEPRWRAEYVKASYGGDPDRFREFWIDLSDFWLRRYGWHGHGEALMEAADAARTEVGSDWFRPYPDAVPCMRRLKAAGLRLAAVSNWDPTLAPILEETGLAPYFEVVVPSLVVGVEKPDPRIFAIALERLGARPEATWHVGDLEEDDGVGARAAGLAGVTILKRPEDTLDAFSLPLRRGVS